MPLTLTADSTEFVSLGEVKDYANVTDDQHDVELDMMRGAAQDVVEGIIGPVLWREVTESVHVTYSGTALLRVAPVVSVSVPEAAVVTSATAGMLSLPTYTYSSPVAVTYVAGRVVVPDAVRLATLIIAGHLWETQRGLAPRFGPDGIDPAASPVGFAIPNRAVELLRPYELGPGIA